MPRYTGFIGAAAYPNAVVLQTAIHIVGAFGVYVYRIKLPYRRVVALNPVFTIVVTDVNTAVIAIYKMPFGSGVEP